MRPSMVRIGAHAQPAIRNDVRAALADCFRCLCRLFGRADERVRTPRHCAVWRLGGQRTVGEDLFAASLSNSEESDLRPRLTGLNNPGLIDAGVAVLQKECGGVLAALVLPLLLLEWFWLHRRT